ncbi:MAG TPA: alpha-glucosidase [Verrucomicrobia subdivision 3 bacterium]|nr:alpha-glucosidase [Limisphaerales bacterium]
MKLKRMEIRKRLSTTLILGLLALPLAPAWAAVTASKKLPAGAQFAIDGGTLRIQFWSDDIVRVTYATAAELPALKSLSVIASPAAVKLTRQQDDQAFTLAAPNLKVKIDKRTGAVSFLDAAGHLLLREAVEGRKIAPATQAGVIGNSCAQSFETASDEGIYGLGQHQKGTWNYSAGSGSSVRLAQANTDVGIPVITSSKGYMLLWDNPAVTTISSTAAGDANASHKIMRWSSEWGKAIDYYFCYGDGTIDTALTAYRQLTGNAPLMPKWMLGFWQCKERYASQDELLGVAKKLRELKVPVDGIIQDWQYWPPGTNTWGSHLFDPARYPDPAGMFKELHAMNYHTLISVWAKFDLGSDNSKELNAVGGMFPQVTSYAFPPGHGQWYDPFSVAGRQTYWKQMRDQLFSKGVDGWWLDAPEPEIGGMGFRKYITPMGPGYEVYNAYPLMHSTGIYQGQRAATDKKRVVILTRSAYAGQQRNSAITWSGDIQGTWQVLKNQIPAGLNISLSGIPYWNTDTGGFFGNRATGNGDPKNPQFQELFARWFQFSSFCPMFRVHSSSGLNPGREFYRFDEKTQGILRNYLDLRYRLLPYLYSVAWQVTSSGSTFMRPLVMDFPHDAQALNIGDQYLFGPAIMVTPITSAGTTTRSVYLPAGSAPWYNFWTGETSPAGQLVEAAAGVETLPLFVRPGSIIPLGPFLQYSSEKTADPIELRIYRGADGNFTLYEDEGDSYNYEKGKHATISISWNDAKRILEIGKRSGEFSGMLKDRTFNVVFVSPNHGAGIPTTEKWDVVVHYNGKLVEVKGP